MENCLKTLSDTTPDTQNTQAHQHFSFPKELPTSKSDSYFEDSYS